MLEYRERKPISGERKELILLLHGYGSNQDDLITLAPELSTFLPNAHFIAPNAPHNFEENMPGARQWFSLLDRSEPAMLAGVRAAAVILEEFANALLKELQLSHNQLALLGFSQGSMLAMQTGLRMQSTPRALLCYSGMLIAPQLLQNELIGRPKMMLIHGAEDHILYSGFMNKAADTLKLNQVPVTTHLRPKLAHGIDLEGISLGGKFLQEAFAS
jgi:phospholipase/carboxylesterase